MCLDHLEPFRSSSNRRTFLQRGIAAAVTVGGAPIVFGSAAHAQSAADAPPAPRTSSAPSASTASADDDLQVTWLGHSAIRIEHDGFAMVIDPGVLSAQDAAVGADALLITHEHPDHYDPVRIKAAIAARPGLPIWTNKSVAALLDGSGAEVHVIGDGDAFDLGGVHVQCYGELHAPLHPEIPVVRNTGFLVGGRIFHPGDALTDPRVPVKLLLVPVQEFFARADQLVYYIRQLKPAQVAPVHDGTLNNLGQSVIDHFLAEQPTPVRGGGHRRALLPSARPDTRDCLIVLRHDSRSMAPGQAATNGTSRLSQTRWRRCKGRPALVGPHASGPDASPVPAQAANASR